jgi:ABC-type Fe3+-hydroxamate transport system substrate-binding protein
VKRKKMKTKTLVLVGIAVCVLSLTSPVLASAGYSKIYGNANEDDVLDMRDVTYIKLVIFGKKPATTFADANYDGKISMLDLGQTKLIILGKEKEITLMDMADRTVTVPRPIERVITVSPPMTRMVIGVGAVDKLVGMGSSSHTDWFIGDPAWGCGPKWDEVVAKFKGTLANVGSSGELNLELILSLRPDVVFGHSTSVADTIQESTGIPVVCHKSKATCDTMFVQIEFVGAVLGKDREAEEVVSSLKEKLDKVTDVTSQIPDSEKPRVYFHWGYRRHVFTRASICYEPIELAGGINVANDFGPPTFGWMAVEVSKEQIIAWNPDIILTGRGEVEPVLAVEDIWSDPDLQTIDAVKNRRVYYTLASFYAVGAQPPRVIIETMHMAKLFHPDEFENLDVEKEGNEIFERFYGVDGLWTEIGGNLGFI